MTMWTYVLAILEGGLAAIVSGGICGAILGYKKIDLTLAGLMGVFYGALGGIGVILPVILSLVIR